MRRISTATRVVDKFGAGKDGFTNGNAVSGIAATDLEDVWFDHVQEEIANVVETSGQTLSAADRTQLLKAIRGVTPGRLLNIQIFTSTGTYTQTPGCKAQLILAVGGGASGAGTPVTGASQCAVGGPGGSGAYAEVYFATPVASGTTITIGPGGTPVNGGGNNGGTTSVGSAITCPGGRVGSGAGPSAPPLLTGGGNGATGFATQSGGQAILLTAGNPAQITFALGLGTTAIGASPGADGPWGGGGVVQAGNAPGNSASAPGAGGSGCVTNASQASISGGAGANGRVIIYEFGAV
ncbi:hypothetical protein AWB70_01072 [Caballeronia cordobensis]|uniref:Glycine-rich domain-containing protein n=1 Tax=Caballeronia cordobensis TaxID=1353886 RepID=A0A158FMJ6_CABCO|nr:hypothetical protein [Caballeronia cordobensis]SAL20851.1 hypothetical protein AWB70_01072 [Caballeronia cordobensis]